MSLFGNPETGTGLFGKAKPMTGLFDGKPTKTGGLFDDLSNDKTGGDLFATGGNLFSGQGQG